MKIYGVMKVIVLYEQAAEKMGSLAVHKYIPCICKKHLLKMESGRVRVIIRRQLILKNYAKS